MMELCKVTAYPLLLSIRTSSENEPEGYPDYYNANNNAGDAPRSQYYPGKISSAGLGCIQSDPGGWRFEVNDITRPAIELPSFIGGGGQQDCRTIVVSIIAGGWRNAAITLNLNGQRMRDARKFGSAGLVRIQSDPGRWRFRVGNVTRPAFELPPFIGDGFYGNGGLGSIGMNACLRGNGAIAANLHGELIRFRMDRR